MFTRKIYSEMKAWKEKKAGRYALMLEGPRRVGKSTIIEEFVRNEYRTYIIIKFEETDDDIRDLFHHMRDLDRFFLLLQQYMGVRLYERQSAIVFDEVQLFPLARQSIKTLLEDGRYDYYETGSLISLKKNVDKILIPSEEDSMYMHPMDFEEFLWATGNDMTMPFIRESFERMEPLGDTMHKRILDMYLTYMMVGGMPAVVSKFIEENSFAAAEDVKRSILNLYTKDVAKLDEDNRSEKVGSIFRSIPSSLEKHDKQFSPSELKENATMRDYVRAINDLEDSMMINVCYRSTEPALDQDGHSDRNDLKMYLCDTGLLFTQSFNVMRYDPDEIYKSILKGNLRINEGMYMENMVAQEFTMSGHPLFFAKFEHEGAKKKQEVDFIIVRNREVIPVEVKSGKRPTNHRSLDRYIDKYGDKIGKPFVIDTKDLDETDEITYIPIYMASLL